jgi:DNA helicase II / ATP-dependent DNA helicase PcrA
MSFYPDIMLGPPGTGKTTTLLNILDEELSRGTKPNRIGYVSFTQRAAIEASTRAMQRFGLEKDDLPYFQTLHSMCYRQLGIRGGQMLVGPRLTEFANTAGIHVTGRAWSHDGLINSFASGDRILFMENLARIRGVDLRTMFNSDDDEQNWDEVDRVARALHEYKKNENLVDYTDLLANFVRSGIRLNLDVLLVDEAQDLSHLQWRVVFQLADGVRRVVIAGDDDQAIYRWAGADVEQFIGLDGRVSVLGQSWRCPPEIQHVSAGVIAGVVHRRSKKWTARKGRGIVSRVVDFDEADVNDKWREGAATSPVLILARNLYILHDQIEPLLRERGIVYEMNGKSSIPMAALQAAEAWEQLRAGKKVGLGAVRHMYSMMNPKNANGQAQIKHGFKGLKGFGDDDTLKLSMRDMIQHGGLLVSPKLIWHEALDRLPAEDMSYMLAARRRGEKLRDAPRVRLSTIHSAKGAEADHVVLMTEMAWRTAKEAEQNPDDERRVWYVGVTRARQRLTIVGSQTQNECQWV